MKKDRPTIGLLIGRLGDIGYAANVWPGVAAAAEERDANLVCFVGGALNALHEFDLQRNVIYDLASPENVDGLVAMSGSLGQFVGPERVLRYYDRFRPLPMVSIAMALEGIPSVLVDNSAGMRAAVTHLIEVHEFRRIAFIRGPATNTEAEERFRAYREVLDSHRLSFDPELVVDGNYLAPAGAAAVWRLLEERKARFDAVASANDEMALGAIGAFRERGMCVPQDMAVTGFDNVEEARYAAPPLTTIRQPLYEQGRKAAEMLLDFLAGKDVPGTVVLPTELVIRQSCGCFPRRFESMEAGGETPVGRPAKTTPAARRKQILAQMTAAVGISAPGPEAGWQERLLNALSDAVGKKKPPGVFLHAWDDALRRVGIQGGDVTQWRPVLSILRREALPVLGGGEPDASGVDWRQAEDLIGDVALWAQVHRRLQANRRAFDFMTSISEPLMTAFDIPGLADVVAEQLPRMGVRSCYLSLYEKPVGAGVAAPTEWSRLILAYNESGRVKLDPGGVKFPSRMLVPQDILPARKRYAVMLEPLHFRDESQLGFIMLEPLQTEVGAHREALSRQISTALKGAILLQERHQAEQSLRASEQAERHFQKKLRILLEVGNELSRAESVDALCRQAVELGLSRLGFDRLGIWFRSPDPGFIVGSWGTDERGGLRDERNVRLPMGTGANEPLLQKHPATVRQEDVDLRDCQAKPVGRGMHAQAAMWDGEKTIGLVVTDNLLHRRPITDQDCELLNLYASTLGYLCTRKQAEEKLRASEQRERRFQDRLRILLEISNELSRAESVDEMCRQAVELGRARLGFDRLGIWFFTPDPGVIQGSFGTDENGETCDERDARHPVVDALLSILHQTSPVALTQNDVELTDGWDRAVGRGALAQAAMWDGEQVIGFVSMDNLLHRRPITVYDCELLTSFASTLGYLASRKRAEETLRASERKERSFQDRLRILLEISNELSRAESVDALCRQAVELGRARLGIDRLGIWFHRPDAGYIDGSFGTDPGGNTVDEREIHLPTQDLPLEILKQTRPVALLWPDAVLRDGHANEIGRGDQAQAAMWNGEKVIGFVSMDNLIRKRPITEQDCELLNLFASTLGYLTSRKQAEEELLEYSEHLEEKVDERTRALQEAQDNLVRQEKLAVLGQLTATVSHELRNPLATIRVSTTAVDLKTRDRGLGVERALDRIQRNITRCDTIISELLDYTRMPDLERREVDFDDWLNRLLDEQTVPEGITLRRDMASGVRVSLDGERFQRAIINLLDNARQAIQSAPNEGGTAGTLSVETAVDGGRLKIVIRDTGGGIPPEVLPRIFEPLFSTKGFGVGLGLSIVRGIVEQHGGTIEIGSEPGRGATAVVRLPLIPAAG
ncbi:MAG: substrate-binding domain-containing protein [Anaerolineales bacterium]|nr:substrate-binding domain-containing protein [Anaerolineales bacterium]